MTKLEINGIAIPVKEEKYIKGNREISLFIQETEELKNFHHCHACDSEFLTLFNKIEKCPVCGYLSKKEEKKQEKEDNYKGRTISVYNSSSTEYDTPKNQKILGIKNSILLCEAAIKEAKKDLKEASKEYKDNFLRKLIEAGSESTIKSAKKDLKEYRSLYRKESNKKNKNLSPKYQVGETIYYGSFPFIITGIVISDIVLYLAVDKEYKKDPYGYNTWGFIEKGLTKKLRRR